MRARFPAARIESPSLYVSVAAESEEHFKPSDGERISQELDAEIIYLAFSSVSDSLQFTHCVAGQTVRHLQYGMYIEQGLWEEVDGVAEPWESMAFFSEDAAEVLAVLGDDDPDYARVADIYEQRCIRASEIYPIVNARESARAAAVYYRLTDWLDDWNGSQSSNTTAPPPASRDLPGVTAPLRKPWWRFWK